MVAHDVYVPLMFLSEWCEFPSAPCLAGKKLDDSSSLHAVEITRVTRHASFKPLHQEKACNLAHEQTPLSNNTIDSYERYWEVGRAKDLPAPPRSSSSSSSSSSSKYYYVWKIKITCFVFMQDQENAYKLSMG